MAVTIAVLVVICRNPKTILLNRPAVARAQLPAAGS
jgi:hypothetical protein